MPSKDYFPDKVTVEDAVNFSVTYHRSYKVVSVRAAAAGQPRRAATCWCSAARPAPKLEGELAGAQVATVPITSLYSASTTHLSLLVDLQRLDVLTGVSQMKYLTGDEILKRAASGQVREFAPISTIDAELVVSQRPGVLMTGGATERGARRHPQRRDSGRRQPRMAGADGARARGVAEVHGALPERGARRPTALRRDEGALHEPAAPGRWPCPRIEKPTVMTGRGTRGDFVIAGGRSYVAALIKDAGGRYVWADNTADGSATIDLEAQIRRAGNADIWINGGGWQSLAAMVKDEPRYAEFKAYRTGQVWVYERRVTPAGGERLLVARGLASGPACSPISSRSSIRVSCRSTSSSGTCRCLRADPRHHDHSRHFSRCRRALLTGRATRGARARARRWCCAGWPRAW